MNVALRMGEKERETEKEREANVSFEWKLACRYIKWHYLRIHCCDLFALCEFIAEAINLIFADTYT